MSLTPSWNRFLLLPMLTAVVAGGCSEYDSSFVYSERTTSLIPEAQDGFKSESEAVPGISGVKQLLDDRFGDPQDLKAWLKLPVEFGGTQSAVAEYSAVEGVATVKFSVEEGKSLPETASSVQVVSGALAGETLLISSWDPKTGQATLEGLPSREIAAGDSCVIDGGTVMQSGRVLYMRHCSHCHGTSGDGAGPTAQYLNPRPRDYRHGIFKFTSTTDVSKASRQDIKRVLQYGIPGTYMPSFLLLTDSEIHALVEYVRFLSLRGEYERKLVNQLAVDFSQEAVASRTEGDESREAIVAELKEMLAGDIAEAASSIGDELAETWLASDTEEALIVPSVPRIPDSPESRRRGRELYLSQSLKCAACHGINGGGDGPQTTSYESNPLTNEPYNEPGLHDVWDNLNQPRNLQRGIYRGGRRPIDLFARIHAGIKGSRMPSFKNTPHEDIWHVVNYVLSIPFEPEPGATGVVVAAPPAAAAVAP
jgi:mono/diheme cytochrome c family protein